MKISLTVLEDDAVRAERGNPPAMNGLLRGRARS
jgi:hypothetical protein